MFQVVIENLLNMQPSLFITHVQFKEKCGSKSEAQNQELHFWRAETLPPFSFSC